MDEEIRQLLKKLEVPPEILRFKIADAKRGEFFSIARSSLLALKQLKTSYHGLLVKDVVLALSIFACGGDQDWTTQELMLLSTSIIDDIASGLYPNETRSKCREQLVVAHLFEMLLVVQKSLKHGSRAAGDVSLYTNEVHDTTYDVLLAHQMTWLLNQVGHPSLGQNCKIVMPCVLTALDHFLPPVKAQAMQAFLHIAENMDASELRVYKDVILDAVFHNLIGSDNEVWPLVVKMAVSLVTLLEGSNPRAPWYRKILAEMIEDLELHPDDKRRRIAWLENIGPLLEALGLVLVVHLERLLKLIFYWLSESDDGTTTVLILSCLGVIIRTTWPRMSHHASRIWDAIAKLYQETKDDKTRLAITGTASLLAQCGGFAFLDKLRQDKDVLFEALDLQ